MDDFTNPHIVHFVYDLQPLNKIFNVTKIVPQSFQFSPQKNNHSADLAEKSQLTHADNRGTKCDGVAVSASRYVCFLCASLEGVRVETKLDD